MSAKRIKKHPEKTCKICGKRSDLIVFVSMTDQEQQPRIAVRLCEDCAGTPGVTDRIRQVLSRVLFDGGSSSQSTSTGTSVPNGSNLGPEAEKRKVSAEHNHPRNQKRNDAEGNGLSQRVLPGVPLTQADLDEIHLDRAMVEASGLRRLSSAESAQLLQRKDNGRLSGIFIPYFWPGNNQFHHFRIRLDDASGDEEVGS
jgi:hypothetical protein